MARLGKNQIKSLAGMCLGRAVVVGDKIERSLVKAGCMEALGSEGDSFYVITANGLRAVADAMESGAIPPVTMDAFRPKAVR